MSSNKDKGKNKASSTSPPAQTTRGNGQAIQAGSAGAIASSNAPSTQSPVLGSQGYGPIASTTTTAQNVPVETSQERDDVGGSSAVRRPSKKQTGIKSQGPSGIAGPIRPPLSTTTRSDAPVQVPASESEKNAPSTRPPVLGSQGYDPVASTVATSQNVPVETSQERDDVGGSSAMKRPSRKQIGINSQGPGGTARKVRPPLSTTKRPDAPVRVPANQIESPSEKQDQIPIMRVSWELMKQFNTALRNEMFALGYRVNKKGEPMARQQIGVGRLGWITERINLPFRNTPSFVEVMNPTGEAKRVMDLNLFEGMCIFLSGLYIHPELEGGVLEGYDRSVRRFPPKGEFMGDSETDEDESDEVSNEYPPIPFLRVSSLVIAAMQTAIKAEHAFTDALGALGRKAHPLTIYYSLDTRINDETMTEPRLVEIIFPSGLVTKSVNQHLFAAICLFLSGMYKAPEDSPEVRQAIARAMSGRALSDQPPRIDIQALAFDPNSQQLDSKSKRKRDRKKLKNTSSTADGSEQQTDLDQTSSDQTRADDVVESNPSPDSLESGLVVDPTEVLVLDDPIYNDQLGDGQQSGDGASAFVLELDTRSKSQIKKDKKKLKNASVSAADPEQEAELYPTPIAGDQLDDIAESSAEPSASGPSLDVLEFELVVDATLALTLDNPRNKDELGDDHLEDLDVSQSNEGASASAVQSKSKSTRKREKKKLNKNASGSSADPEQQAGLYPTQSNQSNDLLENNEETSDLVLSLDALDSEFAVNTTVDLFNDQTIGDDEPKDVQHSNKGATTSVLPSASKSKNRNKNKKKSASLPIPQHQTPSDQLAIGDVSSRNVGGNASDNAPSSQRLVRRPQGYDPLLEQYPSEAPSQEVAPQSPTTRRMLFPSTEDSPYDSVETSAIVSDEKPESVLDISEGVSALVLPPANNKNKSKRNKSAHAPPPQHSTPSDEPINVPQSRLSAGANIFFPPNDREIQPAQHLAPDDQPINVSQGRLNMGAKTSTPSPSRQAVTPPPSHIPQFHTDQGSPQDPSTEQEINEKYRQLELRGSFVLEDVRRESMDWCLNSSFYYDAIVPQKPARQTGYQNSTILDTNFFALTVNQEQYYQYMLEWKPEWLKNKTSERIWRTRVWMKTYRLLESAWKSQVSYVPPPHHGVGAYDLGTMIYRTEPIPEVVYMKNLHTIKWKGVHSKQRHPTWDTSMQQIEFRIVDSSRTQRYELVPTDMTELRTKGGRYSRWYKLRCALNNILYTNQGLINKWIEDRERPRLFYPPGYPSSSTDLLAKYVDHPTLGPPDYNDLYVFRRGFHSAARLFPGGVYVNVWTCYAPFFRSNLTVDYVMDVILKQKQLDPYDGRRLNKFELDMLYEALQHIRVMTKLTRKIRAYKSNDIPTRLYRIWGLSDIPCRDLRVPIFTQDSYGSPTAKQISIQPFLPFCEALFSDAFLAWPELDFQLVKDKLKGLPAVKVHKTKDYYFPPWALEIKENDKHSVKKGGILSDTTYRMREESYHKIGAFAYIDIVADYIKWWIASDKVLPSYNIQINPTPLKVKGCFLSVPQSLLCYDYNSQTLFPPSVRSYGWFLNTPQDPRRASSGRAAPTIGMLHYPNIRTHMILYLKPTTEAEARDWIQLFLSSNGIRNGQQAFGNLHMKTPFIRCCGESNAPRDNFLSEFNNALNEFRVRMKGSLPDVIFLMMPSWRGDRQPYHAFKYKCDVELGVKSQVILMRRWEGMNPNSIIASMLCVLLKFNKKMGGQNLVLRGPYVNDEAMPGTMIFGADVTHPTSDVSHSIASVVATNDMPPRTYGARVKIQGPKIELLIELEDMVESLVRVYIKNNPNIPLRRVFFFRDGVGDDQLKEVLGEEIPAIFSGLARAGVQAKLVYLVCIKRHHTRFRDPKSGDIQPGCAVNDLPMFPLQTSFYLCTHLHPPPWVKNRKGLCRATFYHVLVDQLGMSLPQLQTMIYHLSFVYERSNVNLSVVPASHYSHLACSRGRIHFKELLTISPTVESQLPIERMKYVGYPYPSGTRTDLTPHDDVKDTMYYL